MYVRVDVPAKLLLTEPISSECLLISVALRKCKYLLTDSYNPNKNYISKRTEMLSKNLDLYSSQCENNIII